MHKVHDLNSKEPYDIEEYCPYCDNEIPITLDKDDPYLEVTCPVCHNRIMLCTACINVESCDWKKGKGCKMKHPVPFDEMLDSAFAEIYFTACTMEKEGKIEPENTTEELAHDCKQIAADYVAIYKDACKISEPSFYDDMYPYAERRLTELYPPRKEFTVLIDANMTLDFKVQAVNQKEAEKIACDCIKNEKFENRLRGEAHIYNIRIR